jgi:hypothetical protein
MWRQTVDTRQVQILVYLKGGSVAKCDIWHREYCQNPSAAASNKSSSILVEGSPDLKFGALPTARLNIHIDTRQVQILVYLKGGSVAKCDIWHREYCQNLIGILQLHLTRALPFWWKVRQI